MRIDLTNYNATETSTFRIYRSYSTFTEDNLPPVLVELPAETESYLDNTVELNRLVYYRVSVVHNQSEIVGPLYTEMKKYYTGPQVNIARSEPDMILRGNAQLGRYGTLPISSVYPVDQITTDFPNFPWIPGVDYQNMLVEKCIFDNKILFITDTPLIQGSLEGLYNAGVLFTTGDGKDELESALYASITTKVTQGRKIHAAGFTYRFRLLTLSEFFQLYVKLYPTSVMGGAQDKVIANCIPHNFASPIKTTGRIKEQGNTVVSLDDSQTLTDWTTVNPLYMVLELVGRADTTFPDVDGTVKPTLADDRMMYCGGEIVNDRVHFFGGIYSTFTNGMEATSRHISFDLNGEDEQVHAPMPFGVYKPITWTHGNKIYSFGGVRKIGNTQWSYQELYNNIQVWEDNGTPEGLWSVLVSNVTYGFDSCGTVYYDSGLDKNLILIFGGYDRVQPGITSKYYYADVTTFTGDFQQATSYMGTYSGGATLKAYDGYLMEVGGTSSPNGYTSGSRKQILPINPPSTLYMSEIVTQGNELPATKGGQLGIWRDTLFFVTEASFESSTEDYSIFQWAPNESRWLKIFVNAPGLGTETRRQGTSVFNGKRVYTLVSTPWLNASFVSKLVVTDLVDPLDAPLKPIENIIPVVDRIYPPYAKVVTQ